MEPGITVVVPTHDGESTIRTALDSIAMQTRGVREVVVVDDFSGDATIDVVTAHPLGARLITSECNNGVAVARNRGVAQVATDWIMFLDQDDALHPASVELLGQMLAARPEIGGIIFRSRYFALESDRRALDETAHPFRGLIDDWIVSEEAILASEWARSSPEVGEPEPISTGTLLRGPLSATTTYVLRRDILLAAGGFASWIRSADDWVLLQAMSRLATLMSTETRLGDYRVHPQNTSLDTDWIEPLLLANVAVRNGRMIDPAGDAVGGRSARVSDAPFLLDLFGKWIDAAPLRNSVAAWHLARFGAVDPQDRAALKRWIFRKTGSHYKCLLKRSVGSRGAGGSD